MCGLNPNELERKYSSLANKLRNGTFNDAQIITELRTISPETGLFVEKFKEFEPRAKLARYILTKINNKLMKDAGQEELATNNREVNLEHIIPRKMDIVWKQFFTAKGIKGESLIKNIGNLTLLLAEYNNKLANKIFTAKKTMYQSSVLPINNTLKTFGEFSKTEVESRATNYASEADSIWSV